MNIQELENRIRQAAEAYYLAEPIMSDEEFDDLTAKLSDLDPTNPLNTQVGYFKMYGEKTKLPIVIEHSLPKIKSLPEYMKSARVAPKVDGISCILTYKNGLLVQGLTRGDGEFGVDITTKIQKISSIKQTLISTFSILYVRGEIYIDNITFSRSLSSEYKNPRNAVAGIVNSKSFDKLEFVKFAAFDCTYQTESGELYTYVGEDAYKIFYNHLHHPFPTVFDAFSGNCPVSNQFLADWYETMKKSSEFPVDGIVLNGTIAWKSETESKEAVVDHIEWNISNKGRLIPVVVLKDPGVELYGTTVYRASAFNYGYVVYNKLGPDSIIKLTKANEIIPYITEVVEGKNFITIARCPHCNGEAVPDSNGTHLLCKGNCIDQMRISLIAFIDMWYRPKGVGDLGAVIDACAITSPKDLRAVTDNPDEFREKLVEKLGNSRGNSMADAFKVQVSIPSAQFLQSLYLPNIGPSHSSEIGTDVSVLTWRIHSEYLPEDLSINYLARESFKTYIKLITEFHKFFNDKIVNPVSAQFNLKVCVTGTLSKSRKDIIEEFKNRGIEVVDYVNKDVDVLVCNDISSTSSKMKKAQSLGKLIQTEEEFRDNYLQKERV